MAHKVESKETLSQGSRGYLFFSSKPPALWHGDFDDEEHRNILAESGRKRNEIAVAGGMTVYPDNVIVVDGFGSSSLDIREENPAPVAEFIKSLDGVDAKKVLYYGQPR